MSYPDGKLVIESNAENSDIRKLCESYINSKRPKYILGINQWGDSIVKYVDIDGFIDDNLEISEYKGYPIVKLEDIPKHSMVVSAVVGSPKRAQKRLLSQEIDNIDYFAFRKYSQLPILESRFQDNFRSDFELNREKYSAIYKMLADNESKITFTKIINFRLSDSLLYMSDFIDRQANQYFEDFLKLNTRKEVFVDIGCFDGHTTKEFIKRCPQYGSIHVFEPEPTNMLNIRKNLFEYDQIFYYDIGLSDQAKNIKFTSKGSSSREELFGDLEIKVDKLDCVLTALPTFIKMDIEGGERSAIRGAQEIIVKNRPRLAVAAYHKYDDFWQIPEQILAIRKDYKIYLRHYTEGVDETIMFFL